MIASVRGRVLAVRLDSAVVEVGGVGVLVQAAPATLAALRLGEEATLATSLVVREDSLTLFGFADADEREVFEVLQTVSGVGPRLALAMLAVHRPDGLRAAVAAEDHAALVRVPGIGKKGAQRICLELGDRLGPPSGAAAPAVPAPAVEDARRQQVVDALAGLGYAPKQAGDAVDAVVGEDEVGVTDVAGTLRSALRHLSGR
ncbi:Holliday junction branch migration protein RuvA [Paenibacillus sp. TRM 82003]|uniref:Holliday junction branch migration protein RuvA n=1 Tax=Kineococcus sp. TRM81007 TaxID=2925831 RepID=UPI001F55B7D8|nr:Holliday junction branch migration protein RuvA [Kineococcus sp. TRM81007]MCI2238983.1 Holliday junction branch migration protein RuvA [Kineococcus sp. TRM81007]MCI3924403.1 Holliday junction branch migration protein RuvA [Paenibacillus sp. TRM 82003]